MGLKAVFLSSVGLKAVFLSSVCLFVCQVWYVVHIKHGFYMKSYNNLGGRSGGAMVLGKLPA